MTYQNLSARTPKVFTQGKASYSFNIAFVFNISHDNHIYTLLSKHPYQPVRACVVSPSY